MARTKKDNKKIKNMEEAPDPESEYMARKSAPTSWPPESEEESNDETEEEPEDKSHSKSKVSAPNDSESNEDTKHEPAQAASLSIQNRHLKKLLKIAVVFTDQLLTMNNSMIEPRCANSDNTVIESSYRSQNNISVNTWTYDSNPSIENILKNIKHPSVYYGEHQMVQQASLLDPSVLTYCMKGDVERQKNKRKQKCSYRAVKPTKSQNCEINEVMRHFLVNDSDIGSEENRLLTISKSIGLDLNEELFDTIGDGNCMIDALFFFLTNK